MTLRCRVALHAAPLLFPSAILLLFAVLVAGPAAAHTGGDGAGFATGFTHPFGGLDHLLAMLAVGLWAFQQGGRAVWSLPAAFLLAMGAGFALNSIGVTLPHADAGVSLSVLALGLALALALRPPLMPALLLTGVFALCHGFAHGTERPEVAGVVEYATGMLVATGITHGLGLLLARLSRGQPAVDQTGMIRAGALRVAGIVTMMAGTALLTL